MVGGVDELMERSCDALVLAYLPCRPLVFNNGKSFYIPPRNQIENAFEWTMEILGGELRGELGPRINSGTQKILHKEPDYPYPLWTYLSNASEIFEGAPLFKVWTAYRFKAEKREIAVQRFLKFWTKDEQDIWKHLHSSMREFRNLENGLDI